MPTILIHWQALLINKFDTGNKASFHRRSDAFLLFNVLKINSNTVMTTIYPECGSERISERYIGKTTENTPF